MRPQNGLLIFLLKETHSETKSWKSSRILTKKVTTTTVNLGNRRGFCVSIHFFIFSFFIIFLHFFRFFIFSFLFFAFFIFCIFIHFLSFSGMFFLFFFFSFFFFFFKNFIFSFFQFFHFFIFLKKKVSSFLFSCISIKKVLLLVVVVVVCKVCARSTPTCFQATGSLAQGATVFSMITHG